VGEKHDAQNQAKDKGGVRLSLSCCHIEIPLNEGWKK
jgi:hypothetical protein